MKAADARAISMPADDGSNRTPEPTSTAALIRSMSMPSIPPTPPVPPMPGQAVAITPGVLWLRQPLPPPLGHINTWAIADGDAWSVVDTGMQSSETAAAWSEAIAGPLQQRPIRRVFGTHMHPDHIGMAGWLTRRFECRLWMTRLEYLTCRMLVADTGREAPAEGVDFYRRAGWDEAAIDQYRTRFGSFGKAVYRLPDGYRRIRDRERITIGEHEWIVVSGSGHSPEHACLYCPTLHLLISGDQVLPRISSNVSVFPTEPDADPLADWFDSLACLKRTVPDDVLVLPAHNEPFTGLHSRLHSLVHGHRLALGRLRKALVRPLRVIDLFGVLFARNVFDDPHLLGMATGECIAHLNHLLARGEIIVERGDDGVDRYRSR